MHIKNNFIIEGEIDIYLKLFVLLYADDTVLFSDSASDLQLQLNILQKIN
jgi:hypothetical protein